MSQIQLPDHDVIAIRAANPGPLTLEGTNSWIVGREPAWLIDPGPDLPEHLDAVSDEIDQRGGLGGILITHDHRDHSAAVAEMVSRFSPVPLAAAKSELAEGELVNVVLSDGDRHGPFEVLAAPGHAPDHLTFLTSDGLAFTGDAVLGAGSVFIAPDPGALAAYLRALQRLQERKLRVIAPGHGPVVFEPDAKLTQYIEHRLERERHLLEALDAGARSVDQLLDSAWSDVPAELRPAATLTLAAHLDKLDEEGRLPAGVQRPT